ncbi:MAG TPA: DoxX family protein [Verrucomicrobiae bacterium]|nr:DoxX family protein [Verrucomicrobiae bacterium]
MNLFKTHPSSAAVVLIRFIVGIVFFVEGILKFLYPAELAAGRFARIGIPWPGIMGPFVGGVETICGALLILGLLTRLAAIPLLIDISVAILSTKIPILLGHDFWIFHVAKLEHYGFLSMMHEARTDFSMFLGLIFLLWVGPGKCSFDAWWDGRTKGSSA